MNELDGYDIEDLKAGMSATFAKTITEADIVLFASASGDNNAMHINEEFAQTTQFKGRIAHGREWKEPGLSGGKAGRDPAFQSAIQGGSAHRGNAVRTPG
jgi:3-hydroxybutyryl-CoA dehydratase